MPPEARRLALDFYRDMHAGFTQATQGVAEIKRQAEQLAFFESQAEADPVGFLRDLAGRLKVDPAALAEPDGMPAEGFASQAEMAEWLAKRQDRELERRLSARERAAEERALAARARETLDAELAELAKRPGWAQAQAAVVERVRQAGGALTLTQAFDLHRLPTLEAAANRLPALEAELKALKTDAEARRKAAAALPAGGGRMDGAGRSGPALRPAEAAFARAERRIAAGRA